MRSLSFRASKLAEFVAVQAHDFGFDGGAHRRRAPPPVDQRHFAEIGTGGNVGEEDILAADALLDGHAARAHDEDVVAFFAFLDDGLARLHLLELGARQHFGDVFRRQAGAEDLQDLPLDGDAVDRVARFGDRRHQLQRGDAVDFDEDAVGPGAHGRPAPPSRDQAHFAEDRALLDGNGDGLVLRVYLDEGRAVGDAEERRADGIALEDDIAGAEGMDVAVDHEFAHLQRRKSVQDLHAAAEIGEPFRHALAAGQVREFLLQDGFVRRRQLRVAADIFDGVVALVHAVLDERIARQRADDVKARHGGFECRRELRIGRGRVAGEFRAGGFHEFARRQGAQPRDHAIASEPFGAFRRLDGDEARFDQRRRRVDEELDAARIACGEHQLDVGFLGAREIGRAVDDGDDVVLRGILDEAERILDAGIARADDEDLFVDISARIVERVLYMGEIGAGTAQEIGIALRADGEDQMFGVDRLAIRQRDGEIALRSGDRFRLGFVTYVYAERAEMVVPVFQQIFAFAGGEGEVRAQNQLVRRRHDVFAALVSINRVGGVLGLFEQDVAQAPLCSMGRGAQTRRARTEDGDLEAVCHGRPPPTFNRRGPRSACRPGRSLFRISHHEAIVL